MFELATVKATAEFYRVGAPLSGPPLPFTTRTWEYPWVQQVLRDNLAPPGTLLDAGCACNPLMGELADQGYKVTGLDAFLKGAPDNPSPTGWGIDMTWEGPNLKLQLGDITDIPFPDGNFDGVYSVSVLEHIEVWMDKEAVDTAIREMIRVLRPGGLLIITEDYIPSPVRANVLIKSYTIDESRDRSFRHHIEVAREYGRFLTPGCNLPTDEDIDRMRDEGRLQLCCAVHPDEHYHFTALGYAFVKGRGK